MTKTSLILCHLEGRLAAWLCLPQSLSQALLIEGETTPKVSDTPALEAALRDVAEHYDEQLRAIAFVHWVMDNRSRAQLQKSIPDILSFLNCSKVLDGWQQLAWEWLAPQLVLPRSEIWNDAERLERVLVPWLTYAKIDGDLVVIRQELDAQRHRLVEDYEDERQRLNAEIDQLRRQRDALVRADLERLATYLPALYQNIFEIVSPADLALQCGHLAPPSIPSPYPEPAPETIRRLQRDFRSLPTESQAEILRFARGLAQAARLRPRPEMREWFESESPVDA